MTAIWILSQASTTLPTGPGTPAPWYVQLLASPFALLAVGLLLMLWFSSQTKKKQEKERRSMLDALKKGVEVQTIGGVFGKVMETRDDRVLVKVDEGSNAKVWFTRSAISKVIDHEKSKADA